MTHWTDRTRLLLGDDGLDRLASSRVAVVGVGGVGGYAAEMLVRAGLGHILIIDNDEVGRAISTASFWHSIPLSASPRWRC